MIKITHPVTIKTKKEIKLMQEGGRLLFLVKKALKKLIQEGHSAWDIETEAVKLINKKEAQASFKFVPGYSWATCVNVNEGVVHGIPHKSIVFKKKDLISVDLGLFYKGFHTDSSFSLAVKPDTETSAFLDVGREALNKAISEVKIGSKIYDISAAIESTLVKAGLSPIKALVGHGIGRHLHEEPQIPCFVSGERKDSPTIREGMTLAIEVMYTAGSGNVKLGKDGWTISTADGKIAALFEETVAATKNGPLILT